MARKLRVQYPDAIYRVMNRGNRREDMYLDDVDRQKFLKTLAQAYAKQFGKSSCEPRYHEGPHSKRGA